MTQITINTNEIQQFVMQTFGDKKITAVATENVVLLIADTLRYSSKAIKNNHDVALNKLCGMFKNTSLLSSDDFARNKEYEKRLDEI